MTGRFVLTGAPGTGKTSVLAALARRYSVVPEPARRIIADYRASTGDSAGEPSAGEMVSRMLEQTVAAFDRPVRGLRVHDRGIPDVIAYAEILDVDAREARLAATGRRYADPVFVFPPWEDIHTMDDMRRMEFRWASDWHDALVDAYRSTGHELLEVPRLPVPDRARFIEAELDGRGFGPPNRP